MTDTTRIIHGSLISIFDVGILILGESGSGKSSLCLEMIGRGHKLVADDAVMLSICGEELIGQSPPNIAGLLEIRGTGIINVADKFGTDAVRKRAPINWCLEFSPGSSAEQNIFERGSRQFLGIDIPNLAASKFDAVFLESVAAGQLKLSAGV